MPEYDYACPDGHTTTMVLKMTEAHPATVECDCGRNATRVFQAPAAIHFHGRGFTANDFQNRKRRPNPGDDLPRQHDPAAAAIARSL